MVLKLAQQNRWVSSARLHVVDGALMLPAMSGKTNVQLSVFKFLNSLTKDTALGSSIG